MTRPARTLMVYLYSLIVSFVNTDNSKDRALVAFDIGCHCSTLVVIQIWSSPVYAQPLCCLCLTAFTLLHINTLMSDFWAFPLSAPHNNHWLEQLESLKSRKSVEDLSRQYLEPLSWIIYLLQASSIKCFYTYIEIVAHTTVF